MLRPPVEMESLVWAEAQASAFFKLPCDFECAARAETLGVAHLCGLLAKHGSERFRSSLPQELLISWSLLSATESALLPGHAGPPARGSGHRLWLPVSRGKSLHPPVSLSGLALSPPSVCFPTCLRGPDRAFRAEQ